MRVPLEWLHEYCAPEITPAQLATAEEALRVGALVLTNGLSRVSTLRLADLVRVAHACRKEGLPRLEGAVMAGFDAARALRDEDDVPVVRRLERKREPSYAAPDDEVVTRDGHASRP